MENKTILEQYGAIVVPKILPLEFCHFFTHTLLRQAELNRGGDKQVPTALSILVHDLFLETMQERVWPSLEDIIGEELLPTYSFSRLYSNGDELHKHRDRPSCEISVTIQLGRSHHYSWPIYVEGTRFDWAEGDGVVYLGEDVEHWRNKCDGPEGYYSGQLFMHFVRANGKHAEHFGDSTKRESFSYIKDRTIMMDRK